tara:strand:+ start:422 stop:709 length:288 start_codon:yes stop_codon:yes gene_type:complete
MQNNKDSDKIYIVDKEYQILEADEPEIIGTYFKEQISKNHQSQVMNELRHSKERFLTKMHDYKPVYLSAFPCDNKIVILQKFFVHPISLKGYITS